jgi:hypothetical protein
MSCFLSEHEDFNAADPPLLPCRALIGPLISPPPMLPLAYWSRVAALCATGGLAPRPKRPQSQAVEAWLAFSEDIRCMIARKQQKTLCFVSIERTNFKSSKPCSHRLRNDLCGYLNTAIYFIARMFYMSMGGCNTL